MKTTSLPLCVDLDGTLIKSDVLQETLLLYIYHWPWKILNIIWWLIQGRAYLKQQLATYIDIAGYELPYHQEFLEWLKQQKSIGRQLILVTASDEQPAHAIADKIGVFDDVMASNGKINLRADAKAQALTKRFNKGCFAYAGNSKDDVKVWAQAGEIIAVNTPPAILMQAQQMNKPFTVFARHIQPSLIKALIMPGGLIWLKLSILPLIIVSLLTLPLYLRILNFILFTGIIFGGYNLFQMITMRSTKSKQNPMAFSLIKLLQDSDITIAQVFKLNIVLILISIYFICSL